MLLVNTGLVIQGRRDTVLTLLLVCTILSPNQIATLTLQTVVLELRVMVKWMSISC